MEIKMNQELIIVDKKDIADLNDFLWISRCKGISKRLARELYYVCKRDGYYLVKMKECEEWVKYN